MATTNDKQKQHLATLANAFFEQLTMLECEYGAPGLDPKRPFGNSDVERDILVLLDIDPEGKEGDAESFSDRQREYAADLFKVQLIPFLQKAWATPPDAGLAVRALEELHQLGYVVRDGLLYPPERTQPAGDAAMPCGHPRSLMLKSAETGADLYCELCDAQSGRRDAEQREADLQADLVEERNRIAGMRVEWADEVAALQAEGAKSERRAIEFGDALHRHILAMRAAVVDRHRVGPRSGMQWIANTLAGPGHLPSEADIALGAQALFDKEVAEHDAFRAAHHGPGPTTSNPAAGAAQALRDAVQLCDMLAASEHAEPSGEEP